MLGQPVSMLIPQVVGFRLTGTLPRGRDRDRPRADRHRRCCARRAWSASSSSSSAPASPPCRSPTAPPSPTWRPSTAPPAASSRSTPRRSTTCASPAAPSRAGRAGRGLLQGAGPVPRPRRRPSRSSPTRSSSTSAPSSRASPARAGRRTACRSRDVKRSLRASELAAMLRRARKPRPRPAAALPGGGRRPPAARRAPSPRSTTAADGGALRRCSHGSVVIAAITSCTNTSNPSVMLAAGLLAKKAVERGLQHASRGSRPASRPARKVVTDYLDEAGLTPYLEQLGFHLVGYGCTTCIGNTGPLPDADLAGDRRAATWSSPRCSRGNRNFEGRINPRRARQLPRLAAAGRRLRARRHASTSTSTNEPLGTGTRRQAGLPARHLADAARGRRGACAAALQPEMFRAQYADVFAGDERWQRAARCPTGDPFAWDADVDLRPQARRTSTACRASRAPVSDIRGARVLARARRLGHHRPHLARRHRSRPTARPASTCIEHGVAPTRLQLLRRAARQPRGDGARHLRQHPPAEPAGARRRGRRHASTCPTASRCRSTTRRCGTRPRACR